MKDNGNLPPGVTDKMIEDQYGPEPKEYFLEYFNALGGSWDHFATYYIVYEYKDLKVAGNDFDVLKKGFQVRLVNDVGLVLWEDGPSPKDAA